LNLWTAVFQALPAIYSHAMHCNKVHISTSGAGWLGTPIVLVVPHAGHPLVLSFHGYGD